MSISASHRTHTRDGVPGRSGQIAHSVVASMLLDAEIAPGEISDHARLQRTVHKACAGVGKSLNGHRIYISAFTAASKYLSRLRPLSASLLAAEETVQGVRPDLTWLHSNSGVFFDELKTGRYVTVDKVQKQVVQQLLAGIEEYGASFLGVRVLSTSIPSNSLMFLPDGSIQPLQASWLAIPSLRPADRFGVN